MAKATLIHSYHLVTISFGVLVSYDVALHNKYCRISNDLDTINLYTPFPEKDANFPTPIYLYM